MKIGISSASLYPYETEKSLDFLGRNGVEVTEIFFNSPSELKPGFVSELKKIREYHGIEVASIHPCGSVGEPYFLFSGYERRYRDAFDYYKQYYYAAQELGAKTVVLHGDSLAGHIPMEEYAERLMEMNTEAEKYGASICHENANRYRAATPENVLELRRLTNDRLKFTFDIKQSVRNGCGVDAMYEAMRGNVINVHISDHSELSDCMLPLSGDFKFKPFFERLKNDGYNEACLIEVYRYAYADFDELLECYKNVKKLHNNY